MKESNNNGESEQKPMNKVLSKKIKTHHPLLCWDIASVSVHKMKNSCKKKPD
jgi:hypothetical protein